MLSPALESSTVHQRSTTVECADDGAMAPGMAVVILWLITASFLLRISFPLSQSNFTLFIVAPDVFYMDHEETVSVTVFNAATATVELYLTNEPVDTSIFSRVNVCTQLGQPTLAKVRVTRADLLWGTASEEYVSLVAKCTVGGQTVQKKTLVYVSMWSHSVFLQTDKPIYTPRQTGGWSNLHYQTGRCMGGPIYTSIETDGWSNLHPRQTVCTRIFTMDRHLRPADVPVRLDFLNPDGIIVERSSDLHSADGFLEKNFTFPSSFGVQGKWSLVAAYGVQNSQNVTAKFLVKEYVLPTFAVTIGPPKYIYRGATVTGNVTARHVYGKPVKGTVYMKFGVIKKDSPCLIFAKKANFRLNNGGVTFTLNPGTHLRGLGNEFAFPALEGAHLHIEATVTETATGKKESRIDRAAVFAIKKHKVSFERSSEHFKPGLPYVVKVTLTSASGLPSTYLPLTVNAVAIRSGSGQVTLSAHENQAITDDQGRAMFSLDIPSDAVTLVVKAWPTGHKADVDRNTQLNLKPYNSPTRSYLLARPRLDEYMVGNIMEVEVLATALSDIKQLNYMVIVRGEIVYQRSVTVTAGILTTLHILVTPQMSPSARLFVYYIRQTGGSIEVVDDAVWIDIKDECHHKVSLSMSKSEFEPGEEEPLQYRGASNSKLLLLAVDQAVYALGGKNMLTAKKLFDELERYDLGCGHGGGKDNADVLKNTGLTSVNNAGLVMTKPTGCDHRRRHKRALRQITERDTDKCCRSGRCVTETRTCRQRAVRKMGRMTPECARVYFRCCSDAKFRPNVTCRRSRPRYRK
ncbi:Complement C3 [Lamellibrachia satsuma]|nr:Complement C3 [Lamellibrachia satsuma]